MVEDVDVDDGTIGAMVLERAAPIDLPTVTARLLSGGLRMVDHRRVSGFRTSQDVRVVSVDGRPVPLQVDGDYIGDAAEVVFGVWLALRQHQLGWAPRTRLPDGIAHTWSWIRALSEDSVGQEARS